MQQLLDMNRSKNN